MVMMQEGKKDTLMRKILNNSVVEIKDKYNLSAPYRK